MPPKVATNVLHPLTHVVTILSYSLSYRFHDQGCDTYALSPRLLAQGGKQVVGHSD